MNTEIVLREFEFETVYVDRQGAAIRRAPGRGRQFVEDLGGARLEMVALPGGMFQMGSLRSAGYAEECPQHTVTIPPFYMGRCPVTQEQWQAVMGKLPACRFHGARRPVENVSWEGAVEFCRRLSARTGRAYVLPSEAQWEYACRAGTATPFYCGEAITTDLANYCGEYPSSLSPKGVYRHETTDAGCLPPNPWGLADMAGNVWEWCADSWHPDHTGAPIDGSAWSPGAGVLGVLRGGSWHDPADMARCAARAHFEREAGDDFMGFRVSCRVEED